MADKKYTGEIERIGDFRWRLPRNENKGMLTDGVVYADETLFEELRNDPSLWQIANVACLPGIVGSALAMPDCHYGYGFPIGGVAACDIDDGVISPGGVGYDINCGVRVLRTDLTADDVRPVISDLADLIFNRVPSGVGREGQVSLSNKELDRVLAHGTAWAVNNGYGTAADIEATEEGGELKGADPAAVSNRAKKRAKPQLGTLGSGNHFLEIQIVDAIYDPDAASHMGVDALNQVCVMIHCGSRGFGHQVCDDAIDVMRKAVRKYDIHLPDAQLACAPIDSPEGREYYSAMAAAANYAWANRQVITHIVREAFEGVMKMGTKKLAMDLVWDVAHNVAKFETHQVNGDDRRLCIHRKGATRAFGPGRPELPERYRHIGQPVIVPGDMQTRSYVLLGTRESLEQTWGSTCHGAGRQMSRTQALKLQHGNEVAKKLQSQGIQIRSAGKKTLAEEATEAYKEVDRVVETCEKAGISRKVARMRPIAVIKG